jgi:hypothetical protein
MSDWIEKILFIFVGILNLMLRFVLFVIKMIKRILEKGTVPIIITLIIIFIIIFFIRNIRSPF